MSLLRYSGKCQKQLNDNRAFNFNSIVKGSRGRIRERERAHKRYVSVVDTAVSFKGIIARDAARDFHGLNCNGYERNLSVTAALAIAIYPRERAHT